MSTKLKLIIALIVIGGGIASLNVGLMAWYNEDQSAKTVAQTEKANQQAEVTNAQLEKDLAAGNITQDDYDSQKSDIQPITWIDRNDWIVMTVWVGFVQFALLGLAALMLWRRDDGLPITWGESIVYGLVTFGYMIIVFGFIPHWFISIWDSIIQPAFGTQFATIWPTQTIAQWFNPKALGWEWTWEAIRDMIVAGWYIVTLVAMFVGWYWAQEYPKRAAKQEGASALQSPYGRPVLTPGK